MASTQTPAPSPSTIPSLDSREAHPTVAAAMISALFDQKFWGIPLQDGDPGEYELDGDTLTVLRRLAEQA